MKNKMATLETQYQNYLQTSPDPQLNYKSWMERNIIPPDDSDISDWDVTLQDGLEDEPWDNED